MGTGIAPASRMPRKLLKYSGARRQHDGHRFARRHPCRLQARGHGRRSLGELEVADRVLVLVQQYRDLRLLGMRLDMPGEHLEQRRGGSRAAGRGGNGPRFVRRNGGGSRARLCRRGRRRCALQGAQHIGHGFHRADGVVREGTRRRRPSARSNSSARAEAVEAEIAVELAGERHGRQVRRIRTQFTQGRVHQARARPEPWPCSAQRAARARSMPCVFLSLRMLAGRGCSLERQVPCGCNR